MVADPLRLDAFIPFRLSVTSNLVSETIASTYQALFGLTIPEWRLIAVIAEDEGTTQQQVGRRTRMDKVTVSRATIALVERGLVERRPHSSDRRSQSLHLTKSGRDLYAAIAPKALELERRIFADFAPEDVVAFSAMLLRVQQATLAVRDEA
ncbi:MarR family winged helix-turn-helix transcriptional regulator [Sphingomonas crusticola]|uniref:MarR family winged helix-turn-helix transcriptional regulator n=1 Tax=Sphingomonas crusticola TaxID=1697973 RepID=UPI000E26E4BB|nr:MarR family transcriptional regulator [Sphingomonas crusticola]